MTRDEASQAALQNVQDLLAAGYLPIPARAWMDLTSGQVMHAFADYDVMRLSRLPKGIRTGMAYAFQWDAEHTDWPLMTADLRDPDMYSWRVVGRALAVENFQSRWSYDPRHVMVRVWLPRWRTLQLATKGYVEARRVGADVWKAWAVAWWAGLLPHYEAVAVDLLRGATYYLPPARWPEVTLQGWWALRQWAGIDLLELCQGTSGRYVLPGPLWEAALDRLAEMDLSVLACVTPTAEK